MQLRRGRALFQLDAGHRLVACVAGLVLAALASCAFVASWPPPPPASQPRLVAQQRSRPAQTRPPSDRPKYPFFPQLSRAAHIPNRILRTWKTSSRSEIRARSADGSDHPERFNWFRSWDTTNPRAVQILVADADMDAFVRSAFSARVVEAYFKLPKIVLRADFLRYLMLYELGGVYADFDVSCHKPVWAWTLGHEPVGVIVGVEDPGYASHPVYGDKIDSIQQWTMANSRHHPFMAQVIHAVMEKIHSLTPAQILEADVLDLTGPGIFKRIVWDYLVAHGANLTQTANMFEQYQLHDDVLVVGKNYLNSKHGGDPNAFIVHHSTGFTEFGWRKQAGLVNVTKNESKHSKIKKKVISQDYGITKNESSWIYVPPSLVVSDNVGSSPSTRRSRIPKRILSVSNASNPSSTLHTSWKALNPGYFVSFMTPTAQSSFIQRYCSSHERQALAKMNAHQREKLFKFLWLRLKGGIFVSPESECKTRIRDWSLGRDGVSLVMGFRAQQRDVPALQQNFIATGPKHPVITGYINAVMDAALKQEKVESFDEHVLGILKVRGLASSAQEMDWTGAVAFDDVLIHGNERFSPSNSSNPSAFVWDRGEMYL
ncbi:hypothetical protein BC830DRAFT_1187030 [Chytriomyces sp. MP71]|nr:hypothetical protein BC830DRAFT_1187030 [Chytriomyces sp. MP71]